MNKSILLLLSIFFLLSAQAQEAEKFKSEELGMSIGAAIPTGDFASERSSGGMASTAYLVQLNFNHRFTDLFGITAIARHQSHKVDPDLLKRAVVTKHHTSVMASTTDWKINSYLLGAFVSLPFGPESNFYMNFEALAGLSTSSSPALAITAVSDGYNVSSTQSSGDAKAFTFMAGAGLKYYFSEEMALSFAGDFIASEYKFEDIRVSSKNSSNQYESSQHTVRQEICSFNLHLGILFLF